MSPSGQNEQQLVGSLEQTSPKTQLRNSRLTPQNQEGADVSSTVALGVSQVQYLLSDDDTLGHEEEYTNAGAYLSNMLNAKSHSAVTRPLHHQSSASKSQDHEKGMVSVANAYQSFANISNAYDESLIEGMTPQY